MELLCKYLHLRILCQVKNRQVKNLTTFGQYLKGNRDSKGLTQDQLARELNIPFTDISKIENGRKKFPFARLKEMADFFGLDFTQVRDRYGAEILVEQAEKYGCTEKVFAFAEDRAKYIASKNAKQGDLKF